MTPKEMREKTPAERQKLLHDLKEELFRMRLKKSTGQLEKTHRLAELKKDIARLLTLKAKQGEGRLA